MRNLKKFITNHTKKANESISATYMTLVNGLSVKDVTVYVAPTSLLGAVTCKNYCMLSSDKKYSYQLSVPIDRQNNEVVLFIVTDMDNGSDKAIEDLMLIMKRKSLPSLK